MLIKGRDDHDADLESLRRLLDCQVTPKQRDLIEREIKCINAGARGEDGSAYYIDFRYKDSPNWAVVHDLRLEYRGFVAQIDHLLINRFLDIYVLESKNYSHGIKITPEGEFLAWNGKTYLAIESPIEQNKRHVDLLQRVIQQPGFSPTKLGVTISLTYLSYVMVAPKSRVDRPASGKFDSSMVIKADALVAAIDKRFNETPVVGVFSSLAKMVSQETLETLARRLVRLHRQSQMDFGSKYGVTVADASAPIQQSAFAIATTSANGNESRKEIACAACGTAVDGKVVYYCRINKDKFGGKVLCRSCQQTPKVITVAPPKSAEPAFEGNGAASGGEKKGMCEKCGAAVDGKVVFFCRMNKGKFEGKILCRSCQKAY